MDERLCFVSAWLRQEEPMSSLCRRYGVSRKTGYKWLDRYEKGGAAGLQVRSSAPRQRRCGMATPVVSMILELRRVRPSWGPRKLRARLMMDHPDGDFPAASTIGDLLRREALSEPRQRRRREPASTGPVMEPAMANDSWAADFKGWFRTGDGLRCEPLTISDGYSRYLLVSHAVAKVSFACAQPLFEGAFREHGLPLAIRTDNGSPFASRLGLAGLTRLSVWFLKLGIWPDRIAPGRPDQNGRHARMHRTLAQDVARPPAATLAEQQIRLDTWREDYNQMRPHEALGQSCPASFYQPSQRPYPEQLAVWHYPADHYVRRVAADGYIRWQDRPLYLSEALRGETIAIAQRDDGDWAIRFRSYDLAIPGQADADPVARSPWQLTCVNMRGAALVHAARVTSEDLAVLAIDVMTPGVITAAPDAPIAELIRLMLSHGVSAIPIVDGKTLVGIVSEGDLIHRAELGSARGPSYWHVLIRSSAQLAAEYVHTHGRTARTVMSAPVITVPDTATLGEIAGLLETHHIRRVPVLHDGSLLGIVSRANLLRALAAHIAQPRTVDDGRIRDEVLAGLRAQPWGGDPMDAEVMVQDGVVHLWGLFESKSERDARIVLAEGVAGVRQVKDHMDHMTTPDPMDRPNWPTPLPP
jgi:CBS domain-containing protein/transposase InsO family protein